jgi:hypothetical protein
MTLKLSQEFSLGLELKKQDLRAEKAQLEAV